MRIAVTGATGFLGANLIPLLVNKGHVRILINDGEIIPYTFNHDLIETITGSLLDDKLLNQFLKDVDIVYHLAAVGPFGEQSKSLYESINVIGTQNVIKACQDCNVRRLIYTSSIHIFDSEPEEQLIDEHRKLLIDSQFLYDQSKADAFREVEKGIQQGLDIVTIIPTGFIGPNDYKVSPSTQMLKKLYKGKFCLLTDGGFNFVDVRDVAAGAILAAEKGEKGNSYILGGHYYSIREIVELVEEVLHKKHIKLYIPLSVLKFLIQACLKLTRNKSQRLKNISYALHTIGHHQKINDTKAKVTLGYTTRPLKESIEDSFAWMIKKIF